MQKIDYSEWIRRGSQDELSMDGLIDDKVGHPNTACFLSQQMVEKYWFCLMGFILELVIQEIFPTLIGKWQKVRAKAQRRSRILFYQR